MMNFILHQTGKGLELDYQLIHWHDIDGRFKSRFGAVPYSPRLHRIIEGLIEKEQLKRNPQNPIELQYCG